MENEYNPYNVNEYKRERPVRAKEQKKGGDFLIRVISVQMILCIILAGTTFILFKTKSEKFLELKTLYAEMSSKDMSPQELKDVFKVVTNFIVKPVNTDTKVNENETTENTTAENTTTGNTVAPEDALEGEGGEDLKLPQEKTSFSPIMITQKFSPPLKGKFTSKFGYRTNPITNVYGFHTGLDIAAKIGTNISSAYDGVVKKVAFSSGRGNYLIIEHGKGVETVYCHCSEILVTEGTVIRGGETVAKVGVTGDTTGPHLHFEVLINNVWCNPMWLFEE